MMNRIFLILSIILLIRCDSKLDCFSTINEEIPVPTNKTIAYIDKNLDIRISSPDYTESYRLTYYLGSMLDWSPDKRWLVYTFKFMICKMKYDGSEKTVLTPDHIECQGPRFSPDGEHIVFGITRPDGWYEIYISDKNGRNMQQVTSNKIVSPSGIYSFVWPDWSPDGNKIIFRYNNPDLFPVQPHIGIIDLTTNKFETISFIDSLHPIQPRWSPKRNEFLCTCNPLNGDAIYLVNMDDKIIKRLTHEGYCRSPEWNSDGEWFLYERIEDPRTMWMMRRDGNGNQPVIIGKDNYGSGPTW